mmetsp:Transcript_52667/g.171214  ORF Transcript_52667/g.171214 Transcript_52667/m.171214 type:complete len:232 (-) Transcript_52667:955-1650(-)
MHWTRTALHWFQSWGQCLCSSKLHRSSPSMKSSTLRRVALGQLLSFSSSVALCRGEPSLSPLMALLTRTCQAASLGAACAAAAGCTEASSVSTAWYSSDSAMSSGHDLVGTLPSSALFAPAAAKRCGSRFLTKLARCCPGSATKSKMTMRGSTRKSSTSQSSHIDVSAGATCWAARTSETTSQMPSRSGASRTYRAPTSQLVSQSTSLETSPGLLQRWGSTRSMQVLACRR